MKDRLGFEEAFKCIHGDSSLGIEEVPEQLLMEILSQVSRQEQDRVDDFVGRLQSAQTTKERIQVVGDMSRAFPNADRDLLVAYAATGVPNDRARRMLRLTLMFEAVAARQERDLMVEVAAIKDGLKSMDKWTSGVN